MRTLALAILVTPLLVMVAYAGCGYPADRPDRFAPEPDPAQRVAEAIKWCRMAGYPVVRLEVTGATTRVRCASMSVTVHQARIVK
jgi:hypothetical protein